MTRTTETEDRGFLLELEAAAKALTLTGGKGNSSHLRDLVEAARRELGPTAGAEADAVDRQVANQIVVSRGGCLSVSSADGFRQRFDPQSSPSRPRRR